MEFGIQSRGDWDRLRAVASWAEGRELTAFALPDHYLQRGSDPEKPAWDHLVHLAALAVETDLELVSLVSPVTFRHPAVLYKMGVTIDEISGGLFTLGLGTGWMDEEFELFGIPYPDMTERMERLEEAMAYLRAALTPGGGGYAGKHYTLADFDPRPQPTNLRLLAGGAGRTKARRITALYADEYNLYACDPDRYRHIRERTRAEAVEAGRGADEIFWSSAGPAVAAKKESDYRRLLEELAEMTGQPPQRIEEIYEERRYPHGPGAKAAEMLGELEAAGCQRFYLQIFNTPIANFDLILDAYAG